MTGRDLGQMRIENDVVVFHERLLDPEERSAMYATPPISAYGFTLDTVEALTEWTAAIDGKRVAYGLLQKTDQKEVVRAFVIVDPDYRGIGIGRFMFRFVTDLAIRNRQRRILVQTDGPVARQIADEQEFEPVPDRPGELQKELKWL